jgi:putative Holliday junction resolvase
MSTDDRYDRDLPDPALPRGTGSGMILGIDLGERRIGVATGDRATGRVAPVATLRRATPERDARSLRRLIEEKRVTHVVVGLPLHLDGRESEQARRTREWATLVGPALGRPITFRDERLSSARAEERLGPPPRGSGGGPPSPAARAGRRARVDREAAAAIVQAELDAERTVAR